jgi:redox-sensitive bicupin YhaK (pirin superfamily)
MKSEALMMKVRRSNERGHANYGWLDTQHTFSFADYYDPKAMGFRVLRVIKEDTVEGGGGFPMHGHKDMEIITIVREGALEHKDTLGTSSVIRPGEVQRMSAGTGIRHSEVNHSDKERVHLFQIWILTDKEGHKPGYEQKSFAERMQEQKLVLVASKEGRNGSLSLHQNADLYCGRLKKNEDLKWDIPEGRHVWLQLMKGDLQVDGEKLAGSDAMAVSQEKALKMSSQNGAEFLLFDLP